VALRIADDEIKAGVTLDHEVVCIGAIMHDVADHKKRSAPRKTRVLLESLYQNKRWIKSWIS
jgi:hypothetical protein